MSDIEKPVTPLQRLGPERLPTAYGGTTGREPSEPGQSLGRVPDPDDGALDEAGDPAHRQADARRVAAGHPAEIDTSGTTAQPETP